MIKTEMPILQYLVGCDLAGVIFIRSYVQLQFDKAHAQAPYLSIYVWPIIKMPNKGSEKKFNINTQGYRDVLCQQINKVVIEAFEIPNDSIVIRFSDLSELIISLKEEDQTGPEALMMQAEGGKISEVW
jgi:hypothetical protein